MTLKIARRALLHLVAGAAAIPAAVRFAVAESYPAHPVEIVVGFAAGSTTDILARLIAPLSKTIEEADDVLTLVGLRLLHERNQSAASSPRV